MQRALGAVVAIFVAALAWVAIWVPFHATDALIYGRWSRLIELYRAVIDHDTDPERLRQAEKRLGELNGRK